MQQSEQSSLHTSVRSAAGLICKIAFKTILRYGWAALIFLTIGLFLLFPASADFEQIWEEQKLPYELQGTVAGDVRFGKYMDVKQILAVSPVISFQAEITSGTYVLHSPVKAVSANYLTLRYPNCNVFPDQSNMPILVLNRYAAEHFADKNESEVTVHAGDSISILLSGRKKDAIICGIVEDDVQTPLVYMSYNEAAKYYPKEENVGLLFLLANKGNAEKVMQKLVRLGVYVSLDQNVLIRWKLLQQQAVLYFLMALGFLSCSVALMKRQHRQEQDNLRAERQRLLLSGLTESQLCWISVLRICFTYICCLFVALLAACCTGVFTPAASISCVAVVFLHLLLLQPLCPQRRQS